MADAVVGRSKMSLQGISVLLASLLLCTTRQRCAVTAQQNSPILGQGIDPVSANATAGPVPVFVSLVLSRVLAIDEKEYRFQATIWAYITWTDPRADAHWSQIAQTTQDKYLAMNASTAACARAANAQWANATRLCNKARDEASPQGCTKPCSLDYEGFTCCDGIWLPAINIINVLAYSQDNWVLDDISYLGNNSVVRLVRIQGTFSNSFDYKKFPLDNQTLKLLVRSDADTSVYYIVPSFVGRTLPSHLSGGSSEASGAEEDEVTGWTITDASLECAVAAVALEAKNDTIKVWDTWNPDDPLYKANQAAAAAPPPPPQAQQQQTNFSDTCVFQIHIDRVVSYYLWMDVFPALLITVSAFCVFFTDPTAIDVRLGTVVTLFLAIVAVQFIITDQIPKTAYLTDFCSVIIASYVILSVIMLEAVIVNYIASMWEFHESKGNDPTKLSSRSPQPVPPSEQANFFSDSPEAEMSKRSAHGHNLEIDLGGRSKEEDGVAPSQVTTPRVAPGMSQRAYTMINDNFKEAHTSLVKDRALAYRIACCIDYICGPLIFVAYVVAVLVIFLA